MLLSSCIPYDRLEKYRTEGATLAPQTVPTASLSIQETGPSSYKIPAEALHVWDATVDILVQSYNINLTNKETGLITTEWDSYYLGKDVFRNKLSVRLRSLSPYETVLTVHNNVESLSQGSQRNYQPVWLPAGDKTNEVKRIIGNLALLLNLPQPEGE